MSVVIALVVLTLLVVLVARYGADSRTGADPTGRDAAWPAGPVRHHTPRADLRILRALARAWAGQVRAHAVFLDRLEPWEVRPAARRSATCRSARAGAR